MSLNTDFDRLELEEPTTTTVTTRRKTKPTPEELKAIAAEKNRWRVEKLAKEQLLIAGYRFALPYGAHLWMSEGSMKGDNYWISEMLKLLQPGYRDVYGGQLRRAQISVWFSGAVIMQDHQQQLIAWAMMHIEGEGDILCKMESVITSHQRRGIGTLLIKAVLEAAPLFVRHHRNFRFPHPMHQIAARGDRLTLRVLVNDNDMGWARPWLEERLGFHLDSSYQDRIHEHIRSTAFAHSFPNPFFAAAAHWKRRP